MEGVDDAKGSESWEGGRTGGDTATAEGMPEREISWDARDV